ncbi:MAG: ATP-grasp domain-containing protein, partial [Spirochaetales bacterium]
ELIQAWTDAVTHSRSGRAIIEEYLDGPEFSIDALISRGRIVIRGIADRHVVFSPYFVEMGHTIPSAYGPEVISEVLAVFEAGVRALGIDSGAAKGDIKYTRAGASVGEIAARLSGGYMSGWTYPYASGLDPVSEGIDIACGLEPEFREADRDWVSAERAYISIPGVVTQLQGLERARRIPYVKDLFPRLGTGDRAVFPSNNVQKAGNILSQAPTRELAERAAEEASRSILIRLQPGDDATGAFLRNESLAIGPSGDRWPPDAYTPSAMSLAYVESMPDILRAELPFASVSIAPVPGLDREVCVDWHGRNIQEGLEAVFELTGARIGAEADLVLGRAFWKAFFRGGYQAAVWVLDTELAERLRS